MPLTSGTHERNIDEKILEGQPISFRSKSVAADVEKVVDARLPAL